MEAAAAFVRVRRTRPPALAPARSRSFALHPHAPPTTTPPRFLTFTRKPRYTPLRYAALASAPSRSLELRAVDQWLERVGVLEAFCAVNPKVRLHRASSLPQAEDVFTPELAPGGIVFRF